MGRYHQAVNASERFGCSRYVDPSPGLTGPACRYQQAASLVAVPDGRNAGTTLSAIHWHCNVSLILLIAPAEDAEKASPAAHVLPAAQFEQQPYKLPLLLNCLGSLP